MKLLVSGSGSGNDINAVEVLIPLNVSATNYTNDSAVVGRRIRVLAKISTVTAGATITWNIKVGDGAASARTIETITQVAEGGDHPFISPEIDVSPLTGILDAFKIGVQSDNVGDTNVTIETETYDINPVDENGRVNVGRMLDLAVTLTNDQLDVNAAQAGGATPISQAGQARTNRFSN